MNLLNSASYEDIAHLVILDEDDLNNAINSFFLFRSSKIIYCKTDFINRLFDHLRNCIVGHILISHHSDYPIDEFRYKRKPPCIKKWFAINVNYINPDLIPIPLGTKTPEDRKYHEPQYKIRWMYLQKDRLKTKRKIEDVVYCNWSITNKSRIGILKKLEGNIKYKLSYGLSFEEYIEELSSYKYIISPEGNGIDNHRTWESLYVGSIPIVIKHPIYDSWGSLPIIQCKDYGQISLDFLNEKTQTNYSMNELSKDYWEKYINDEFLKIKIHGN